MTECDRCEQEFDELDSSEVLEASLCDACIHALMDDIEYYDWQDRYTEKQHERAVSLLSDVEEIECVIESYEDGEIVVHTPYVSSDVVTDFCNHFGFRIQSFGPRWKDDADWSCMVNHGSIFEIVLEYNHYCTPPIPTSVIFQDGHVDNLDGNDKQF